MFSQIFIGKDWIWLFRKKSLKKNCLNRRRSTWMFFKISQRRKFHKKYIKSRIGLLWTSKKSLFSVPKTKRFVAMGFLSKNWSRCKVEEAWTFKWRKRPLRSGNMNLKRNQDSSRLWPSNDCFLFFHGPYYNLIESYCKKRQLIEKRK